MFRKNKSNKKKGEGNQCDCINYDMFPHRREKCLFRKAAGDKIENKNVAMIANDEPVEETPSSASSPIGKPVADSHSTDNTSSDNSESSTESSTEIDTSDPIPSDISPSLLLPELEDLSVSREEAALKSAEEENNACSGPITRENSILSNEDRPSIDISPIPPKNSPLELLKGRKERDELKRQLLLRTTSPCLLHSPQLPSMLPPTPPSFTPSASTPDADNALQPPHTNSKADEPNV